MTKRQIQVKYIEFYFGKADRHFTKGQKKVFYQDWPMDRVVTVPWDPEWNSRKNQVIVRLSEFAGVPVRKAWVVELDIVDG